MKLLQNIINKQTSTQQNQKPVNIYSIAMGKKKYRKNYIEYDNLERANKPQNSTAITSVIGEQAKKLLAVAVQKLKGNRKVFVTNHRYISKTTGRGQRQNLNSINEIKEYFDIKFYKKYDYEGKIYRNSYVFSCKENESCNPKFFAGSNTLQNKEVKGIQPLHKNNNTKSIRSSTYKHKSEFTKNSNFDYNIEPINNIKISLKKATDDNFQLKIIKNLKVTTNNPFTEVKNQPFQMDYPKKKIVLAIKKENTADSLFHNQSKNLVDMTLLLDDMMCQELRLKSGRNFSNTFIYQRLLAMSKKSELVNRNFRIRKGFIAYFSKVLSNEKHDSVKVDNVNFRLRSNITTEEFHIQKQEKYLSTIEYSQCISPEWNFKRKLCAVLERNKAYNLLLAIKKVSFQENKLIIVLKRFIELTKIEYTTILSEAQAVFNVNYYYKNNQTVQKLKFVIEKESDFNTIFLIAKNRKEEDLPEGLWGKMVRRFIINNGKDVYQNWFSKLVELIQKNILELKNKLLVLEIKLISN